MKQIFAVLFLVFAFSSFGQESSLSITYSIEPSDSEANKYNIVIEIDGSNGKCKYALLNAEKTNGSIFFQSELINNHLYTFNNVPKGTYLIVVIDEYNISGIKKLIIE